ncbi:MAG: VWA domain-containing protein [Acidobacteriia bacterium]|nr:VWA domain-containing protein [Terriglobia bacterium]
MAVLSAGATCLTAQQPSPDITTFHVTVDMVQLDVAVTDNKQNYVAGLGPWDFAIYEDGILQKVAGFGEENEAPRKLEDFKPGESKPTLVASLNAKNARRGDEGSSAELAPGVAPAQTPAPTPGTTVFILFDTSNYMYRGFVFAQDAIAQFIKSLDHPDRVAFYSYSRDFARACLPTSDRSTILRKIRTTVAGDDAALYNSLLLTLKDATAFSGRRAVVVFSNGPDNSSMVAPEDVRELAQAEGIPIYMISTQEARLDPLSTAVFERMSATTGGRAYFARRWRDQQRAFASIRDDLAHLYTLSYYPQPNPNHGWRSITVKLVGEKLKNYRVRTRSGYRPLPKPVGVTTSMTPTLEGTPPSP